VNFRNRGKIIGKPMVIVVLFDDVKNNKNHQPYPLLKQLLKAMVLESLPNYENDMVLEIGVKRKVSLL
jgi:hypothetical protein